MHIASPEMLALETAWTPFVQEQVQLGVIDCAVTNRNYNAIYWAELHMRKFL